MIDLTGKTAIVTGGSRGIGRAIALQLAEQGADVVVNYQNRSDAADEVVSLIQEMGRQAVAVQADVRSMDDVQRMVKETRSTFGRIDILVNNAGTTRDGLLMRMSEHDWDIVLDTSLRGAFHCTKAVMRTMMKQRAGRIINISSVAGVAGNPGQANYASAKAGLIGFTKSVAKEMGSRNVTCNAVAPGYIPTELTADLPEAITEQARKATPLGRLGTVEDVAYAVAFLASDEAAFITGHVLRIDGGMAF